MKRFLLFFLFISFYANSQDIPDNVIFDWYEDHGVDADWWASGGVHNSFNQINYTFAALPSTSSATIGNVTHTWKGGEIISVRSATAAINLYYLSYNNISSATEWVPIGENALSAAGIITEATAGVISSNSYHLEIVLPAAKRVAGEWPIVAVGGILYPEDAILEPGAQLQHTAIHLYLYGGESPWPAGTAWKAIYSLEDVTVVAVSAETGGGMILPVDISGIDYIPGCLTAFE